MLLGYPNSWLDRQIFRDENETFRDACVCVYVYVCVSVIKLELR